MNGHAQPVPDADATGDPWPPYDILAPDEQSVPLVFASPHSGQAYPAAFVAASRLDPVTLRRSEDSFVDEIFAAAPQIGAPILRARFPRAYVDPNREPYELDQNMFEDDLPEYVNTRSPRVAGGLGTIARLVTNGAEIYKGKLTFAEARRRIDTLYRPYHAALAELIATTRDRFGGCILVDCHSMPSIGGPMDRDPGSLRLDFVLGDAHGRSCAAAVTEAAADVLADQGYRIARNSPYAGGYTTRHYGRPGEGVHALQIEINRALYMDEERVERLPGLAPLAGQMRQVIQALARLDPVTLTAP